MLTLLIIGAIIGYKLRNATILIMVIAQVIFWGFLNAYYSLIEIKWLIYKRSKDGSFDRDKWLEYLSPLNPKTPMRLWKHFYFDLFYLGVYIEYVGWYLAGGGKEK